MQSSKQAVLTTFAMVLSSLPLSAAGGRRLVVDHAVPKPTELLQAAQDDDRELALKLIARHADVKVAQGDGFSALHWAAYNDDVELTQALLKAGAMPEARTRLEGVTPLILAAANGDVALIDALLAGGAKVDTANDNGTTPLMQAAAAGSPDVLLDLLTHGASVNAREKSYGQTALFFAASRNRLGAIRILTAHGADASLKTTVQKLERVSVGADGEEVAAGAKKNADGAAKKPESTDAKDDSAANPAGERRTRRGSLEKVESAREESAASKNEKPGDPSKATGAKKDSPDAYGFTAEDRRARVYGSQTLGGLTALHVAARDGQTGSVRALLGGHADVNALSETDKSTPLLLALINGHYDTAKFLIEHKADVNLASTDGLSALYAVIDVQWAPHTWYPQPVTAQEQTTYIELVDLLLAHKADPNVGLARKLWFRVFANDETWVDVTGATPFWRAALAGDLAAMQLLADHGAKTNVTSKSGDTALMAAAGVGWAAYWTSNAPTPRIDAAKFCLDHGADINAADTKGYTAIHGAAFRGDAALIQYFLAHGADLNAKTKLGDTVADSANGLFEHAVVHPDTVALLESLGSKSNNNCRSNECTVPTKEDKPVVVARSTQNSGSGPSDAKQSGEKK